MSNDGKECEDAWMNHDKNKGCKVIRTGIGSDYLKICPDEVPTLVEVKDGCHELSPTQKVTEDIAKKLGLGYETKRCNCEQED